MSDESERGGALLRALAELAERTAVLAVQVPDTRAEVDQVRTRLDEMARREAEAAVVLERRLGAIDAGLATGLAAESRRLAAELDGRLREALEVRDRAADRRWRAVLWAVERLGLPALCAAAGALAARKGWIP